MNEEITKIDMVVAFILGIWIAVCYNLLPGLVRYL